MGKTVKILIVGWILGFGVSSFGGAVQNLSFPDSDHALETLWPQIIAMAFLEIDGKAQVVSLPIGRDYFILTPFRRNETLREKRFGVLTDSVRIPWPETMRFATTSDEHWVDVNLVDGLLWFMSDKLRLALVEPKTWKVLREQTVAWDLIRPAKDKIGPGGEPTGVESQQLKGRFIQAAKGTSAPKWVAMTQVKNPSKIDKEAGFPYVFFVATRIPGFAVVLMTCDDEKTCKVSRSCRAASVISPDEIAGISFDDKSQKLVIGNKKFMRLEVWEAKKCYDLHAEKTLQLPQKLLGLTSVKWDSKHDLWLSSDKKDDYHNASVYFWESKTP